MSDIAKRLREYPVDHEQGADLLDEAADRIDSYERDVTVMNEVICMKNAELERLRGAISGVLHAVDVHGRHMSVGSMNDLRRAIVVAGQHIGDTQ